MSFRSIHRPASLALAIVAAAPQLASAAGITGPKKSALEKLEDGPSIRNRVQLRGGRFEAAPALGFTLNDAFQRNVLAGAQLTYHFTESIALGGTAFYGFGFNTGLADEVESKRKEKADGGFSNVGLLASLDFYYTPIHGKFALFGRNVFNYDLHVLVGVGGAQTKGEVSDVEGFNVAPVAGVGLRTFINEWCAVNLEVRDYIYSTALNAVTETDRSGESETQANSELSNNFAVTVGVGFYFPTEPKVGP